MPHYTPMSCHQPEMVAHNPCLTQHSEPAPIYVNQPQQGELPQQHHAWQEVCYLAPNLNVPQPWFTDPTMKQQQQQYNSFPQQPQASPAMFSDAASSAYLHPQPQFHEGQLLQSHIENQEQVSHTHNTRFYNLCIVYGVFTMKWKLNETHQSKYSKSLIVVALSE